MNYYYYILEKSLYSYFYFLFCVVYCESELCIMRHIYCECEFLFGLLYKIIYPQK